MLVIGKRKYECSGGRRLWGLRSLSSVELSFSGDGSIEPFSASFLERQIALGFRKSASSSSLGGHYCQMHSRDRTIAVEKCCKTMTCLTSTCSSVSYRKRFPGVSRINEIKYHASKQRKTSLT
jgi:hypothetical protein